MPLDSKTALQNRLANAKAAVAGLLDNHRIRKAKEQALHALQALRKKKKDIDRAQGELGNVGWWATGMRTFSKMFSQIEDFLGHLPKDEDELLAEDGFLLSLTKTAFSWVRTILNTIYNLIQISERWDREHRIGNLVRGNRVLSNILSISFDIALLITNHPVAKPVLIIVSSAYSVVTKSLNMVKNYINHQQDVAKLKLFHAIAGVVSTENKERAAIHKAYQTKRVRIFKRKERMMTRGVALGFSLLSLAVVVAAIAMGNPMIFAGLVVVGLTGLVVNRVLMFRRFKIVNDYRIDQGLKPQMWKMTLKDLKARVELFDGALKKCPHDKVKTKQNLQDELTDTRWYYVKAQWRARMLAVDLGLSAVMVGFGVAAVLLANPMFFIGVGALVAILITAKVCMHMLKTNDLDVIKPPKAKVQVDAPKEEHHSSCTQEIEMQDVHQWKSGRENDVRGEYRLLESDSDDEILEKDKVERLDAQNLQPSLAVDSPKRTSGGNWLRFFTTQSVSRSRDAGADIGSANNNNDIEMMEPISPASQYDADQKNRCVIL